MSHANKHNTYIKVSNLKMDTYQYVVYSRPSVYLMRSAVHLTTGTETGESPAGYLLSAFLGKTNSLKSGESLVINGVGKESIFTAQ